MNYLINTKREEIDMMTKERTINCVEKFLQCYTNKDLCMGECDGCKNDFSENWIDEVLPSALYWLREGN